MTPDGTLVLGPCHCRLRLLRRINIAAWELSRTAFCSLSWMVALGCVYGPNWWPGAFSWLPAPSEPTQRVSGKSPTWECETGMECLANVQYTSYPGHRGHRFGRWRGWIEKRVAEQYLTITPEEWERRREWGWGNEEMDTLDPEPQTPTTAGLSIQTKGLHISTLSEPPPTAHPEQPPLPPVSTVLRPTHLKMPHFGSRFPPHSTTPIRCLLPLQADRLLLIGHDEGFSVLEMYPQDWNDSGGIDLKGPEDAAVRLIWEGESVFQMLELNHTSGVVLMLMGPEPDSPLAKDPEYHKWRTPAEPRYLRRTEHADKEAPPHEQYRRARAQVARPDRCESQQRRTRVVLILPAAAHPAIVPKRRWKRCSGRRSLRPCARRRAQTRTRAAGRWSTTCRYGGRGTCAARVGGVAAGECERAELCAVDA
ncbi:hypothetical protein B0H14DRAFT_2621808 [Mycena olivaceomarginata]|nr:hypothetical protein B0H14DRAFT_2621808 [Mycena olivaceomarginata]